MEKHKEFDLIKRKESSAPNLTPIQYYEGPDFICCSEILNKPKPKLCESSPKFASSPVQKFVCLSTGKQLPLKPSKCSPESYERDILFRPIRWRCAAQRKPTTKESKPSLGAPIGLSKSSFGMNFLEGKHSDQVLQGFATTLVAFAEYFITPEIEWDEKVLNRILLEGQNLYTASKTQLQEGEKLKESSIKRTFTLCGNTFDLLVNEPFMMGQVIGQEAAVPNLHWGLLKFFKKFQFCLLQIENWYTMLWKNADVYFLFDCFGRRSLDFQSDRKHGTAILICLRHIENVSHLILNLSRVSPEDFFILRNLQVKSLIACGGEPTPEIVDRSVEFEVISPDYAMLRATIHLGSECFKEIRLRHSLPVAFCALINAKIDATPTWNRAVLNKILKLGANFYKQWTQCDISIELGLQDVPNKFVFGQFGVEIAVSVFECGIWKCTPNYRSSELSQSLKKAFEIGSNLLIQIQGRTYAVWKNGGFYYILDPYSHQCCLEKKKIVTASLRMCGTFDKMCCIFTQALLELFEESNYIIHLVKIIKLEKLDALMENQNWLRTPCMCTAMPETDGTEEAISLNDSVIGVDGYNCLAEESPIESDAADLDSPGISQTRLEDYTDMRRDFIEESDEETEDDEDDDVDLDSGSDIVHFEETDDSGDEGSSRPQPREKKLKKKAKKPSTGSSEKKNRKENAGSDLSVAVDSKKRDKKKKENKKEKAEKKIKESKDKLDEMKQKKLLKAKEKEDKRKENKVDKKQKEKKSEKEDKSETEEQNNPKKKSEPDKKAELEEKEKKIEEPEKLKADKEKDSQNHMIENQNEKTIESNNNPIDSITENNEKTDTHMDAIEEERNHTPEPEPEPLDQDGPADQRKSKGETPPIDRGSTEIPKTSTAPTRRQRHQRRKQQDGDDSSSSDEIPRGGIPVGCKPNSYPGYTEDPQNLAVIGSESGSYESLCNLLKSAFRCADRILTMTPWGNYVAFRSNGVYFVFDGCTCNLRSIRHMDLSVGTAGLLCFSNVHLLIKYIEGGKETRKPTTFSKRDIVDQICSKYCSR